jgi:hypothetical protein
MRQDKDRSSKWLLGKHGGSVVRLAGITGFTSWRHLTAEVVAPRRLLDGLIELRFPNEPTPTLVLVEIESYADSDADRQVLDDLMLVAVERGVVPEVVSLVLKPKGNVRVMGATERTSRSGRVRFGGAWPVVQLWELDAERLLADPDVGLVPWVPLAHSTLPPAELVSRCIQRIQAVPNDTERAGLLAVTELLAGFAYPDFSFVDLFRGHPMIIREALQSETFRTFREELRKEWTQEAVQEAAVEELRAVMRDVLQARFGQLPPELGAAVNTVKELPRLRSLNRLAATCPDLAAFTTELNTPTT